MLSFGQARLHLRKYSRRNWASPCNKEVGFTTGKEGFCPMGWNGPAYRGQSYLGHHRDLGPPNPSCLGYPGRRHATRCKGLEIRFESLLLALSALWGELKTNCLPRSLPKVCG